LPQSPYPSSYGLGSYAPTYSPSTSKYNAPLYNPNPAYAMPAPFPSAYPTPPMDSPSPQGSLFTPSPSYSTPQQVLSALNNSLANTASTTLNLQSPSFASSPSTFSFGASASVIEPIAKEVSLDNPIYEKKPEKEKKEKASTKGLFGDSSKDSSCMLLLKYFIECPLFFFFNYTL
jgi:hypothetical protein